MWQKQQEITEMSQICARCAHVSSFFAMPKETQTWELAENSMKCVPQSHPITPHKESIIVNVPKMSDGWSQLNPDPITSKKSDDTHAEQVVQDTKETKVDESEDNHSDPSIDTLHLQNPNQICTRAPLPAYFNFSRHAEEIRLSEAARISGQFARAQDDMFDLVRRRRRRKEST